MNYKQFKNLLQAAQCEDHEVFNFWSSVFPCPTCGQSMEISDDSRDLTVCPCVHEELKKAGGGLGDKSLAYAKLYGLRVFVRTEEQTHANHKP